MVNANFLIFIFVYINNLKIFSFEFDVIQRNLAEYFMKIYLFDIFYCVIFVVFSFYIASYLFGHSIISNYDDNKFTAMKIISSFWIGSLDTDKDKIQSGNISQQSSYFDT